MSVKKLAIPALNSDSDGSSDESGSSEEEQVKVKPKPQFRSKFVTGDSDSGSDEDDSDEEEDTDSDESGSGTQSDSEDEDEDEDEDKDSNEDSDSDTGNGLTGPARFLVDPGDNSEDSGSESSSDEDRAARVRRSAKDTRFEEVESVIRNIENLVKNANWNKVSIEFEKLTKLKDSLVKVSDGKTPKMYIKLLSELEVQCNELFDEVKAESKKLNPLEKKGFTTVRQKVRKLVKEAYSRDIEAFRKDPEEFMQEEVTIEAPTTRQQRLRQINITDQAESAADTSDFISVGHDGKALVFTAESILKNLRTISESRGRKGTDRQEVIRRLEKLYEVAKVDYQRIRVLRSLLAARFDTTSTTGVALDVAHWEAAHTELKRLFDILENNRHIILVETAEEWEDDDKLPSIPSDGAFKVPGSVTSFTERLDDELNRSLQSIDPHTPEYVERLADKVPLYSTILRSQLYQEYLVSEAKLENEQSGLNRIISRRIELIYFNPQKVVTLLESSAWEKITSSINSTVTPRNAHTEVEELIKALCNYIFQNGDSTQRAKAILSLIYWLALHDKYYEARDFALMSHLSDSIANLDTATQVLFNRALVQVGMAAFRKGLIAEAQATLHDICGSRKDKELLAQGVQTQRYNQISPEQERLEKQRQCPFHMHINIELLEAIYLTCSMLLEIPLLAQLGTALDSKKRVISKLFRRHLDYHERMTFTGPPENMREHVLQAAKVLAAGNWRDSARLISDIKCWDLLPRSAEIKQMLGQEIQVEGLRTYLFTYAPYCHTLSLSRICDMFDLPTRKVVSVISKMIYNEELAAALDQVSNSIIFRKGVDLSRLQTLALSLSDKASSLIEANEKTLEQRTQGTANAFERSGAGGGGAGGGQQGRGGRMQRGGRGMGRNYGAGGQGGGARTRTQGFAGGALGRAF